MNKLSVQFHALPHEVFHLMREVFADDSIIVVEVLNSPLRFQLWDKNGSLDSEDSREAFVFNVAVPMLNARTMDEFRLSNPDALFYEIGALASGRLSESWLWSMTNDKEVMARWKKVAKKLKVSTLTGAVAVSPKNGLSAPIKGHRFTVEAQHAYSRGLTILPAAGNSIIRLLPEVRSARQP